MDSKKELVGTTIQFVITIVVLGIVYVVLPHLPGVRDMPFPSKLYADEVGRLIVSIVVLYLVLQYGKNISGPIKSLVKVPKAGEISKDIIFLIATVIAYIAFKEAAETYMWEHMWVYSVIFILIGAFLAIRIFRNLMGSVDIMTDAILGKKGE